MIPHLVFAFVLAVGLGLLIGVVLGLRLARNMYERSYSDFGVEGDPAYYDRFEEPR